MTVKKYVRSVVRKVQCGKEKKEELEQKLLSDINAKVKRGNAPEDVLKQMGTVKETAGRINDTLDDEEKRRYKIRYFFAVVIPTVVIIASMIYYVAFQMPGKANIEDIENSDYFDRAQVEDTIKETVEFLDANDYQALQDVSVEEMSSVLKEDVIDEARENIAQTWGERVRFDQIYTAEIVKDGKHYAIGEITVTYEDVSVTYRFTYNEKMQLAGLYMK